MSKLFSTLNREQNTANL